MLKQQYELTADDLEEKGLAGYVRQRMGKAF